MVNKTNVLSLIECLLAVEGDVGVEGVRIVVVVWMGGDDLEKRGVKTYRRNEGEGRYL